MCQQKGQEELKLKAEARKLNKRGMGKKKNYKEKADDLLRKMDSDGDGTISWNEFNKFRKKLGSLMKPAFELRGQMRKNIIVGDSKIIDEVEKDHPLYAEATDGRGIAYERIGEWDKAEKDLLSSLEVNPNQAYVINYLAYSWIEQGNQ